MKASVRVKKLISITKQNPKAFAKMVNRSLDTARSLMCDRLKLSESLALEISYTTGVSYAWLLGTGAENKPVTDRTILGVEEPFTFQHFERRQADLLADKIPGATWVCPILRDVPRLWALFNTAQSRDGQGRLFVYRWRQFMAGLADDFGGNKDVEKVGQRWVESLPAPWKNAEMDIVAGANFVPPREVSARWVSPTLTNTSGGRAMWPMIFGSVGRGAGARRGGRHPARYPFGLGCRVS